MQLFESAISFNPATIVKSVSNNQQEILKGIMQLYCPQGFECDPCYNKGGFYTGYIPKPKYKFDIKPQTKDTVQADCRALPLENNSLSSLMFDPPFLVIARKKSKSSKVEKRYSGFKNIAEQRAMYKDSIKEFSRVLIKKGILIVKIQDITSGGKQNFFHREIIDFATGGGGFQLMDIFIFIKNYGFTGLIKKQRHARKYHTYFLVFQLKTRA